MLNRLRFILSLGRLVKEFKVLIMREFIVVVALLCSSNIIFSQGLPIRIPEKAVGEMPSPPAPDYAQAKYWAALPTRIDAADVVPENDPFGDRQALAQVDVFYIHPTTYRGIEFWNQPLDDVKVNHWTDESVIARQAAVFNACCRVYAPRYRQATAAAVYAPPDKNPLAAYDFAWADVHTAFLYYMQHWNQGRPYIIVGHSQGAAHTQRWLEEFGTQPKYRRLLVAAYPIGIPIAAGSLAHMGGGISVCATPRAINCLISWNTFDRAGDPAGYIKSHNERYVKKYGTPANPSPLGAEVVCVNPLTFSTANPAAPAAWNLGALPANTGWVAGVGVPVGSVLPASEAGGLGARCEEGILRVDTPPKQGYAIVSLPGGMLHFNDFDLYYQNIRVNAVVRGQAFLDAKNTRRLRHSTH